MRCGAKVRNVSGIRLDKQAKIEKYNVPVRIHLSNGARKYGLVFLRNEQRVSDFLCDGRPFFPLLTKDSLAFVSKASVSMLEILTKGDFEAKQGLFPLFDWEPLEDRFWYGTGQRVLSGKPLPSLAAQAFNRF